MAVYQILIMLVLIYFGGLMFFETSFNLVTEPLRNSNNQGTDRMKLNTIMFYTFILMNLFNQINCRSLDKDNINAFLHIHKNFVFIFVVLLEFIITFMMVRAGEVNLGSSIFGTAPLTTTCHIVCWVLGASVLAVNIVVKRIPLDLFAKFEQFVNLETCNHDNAINNLFCRFEHHIKNANNLIEPQEDVVGDDDDY
jgi:magnesium-transporting ATPase (P-type)